jgi:hypothetical protein
VLLIFSLIRTLRVVKEEEEEEEEEDDEKVR